MAKRNYFQEAKSALNHARRTKVGDVSSLLAFVRHCMSMNGCTFVTLKTSEEEFKQLAKKGFLSMAQVWLQKAREGCLSRDVSYDVNSQVQKYLDWAQAGPEEIGTSEDELEQLKKHGHLAEAKRKLELARQRKGRDLSLSADFVRHHAQLGKFDLVELGTSKEELCLLAHG